MNDTRPIYVAHRGYSAMYPGNSPMAFERAVDYPISMIETDLRLNQDREWMIQHDQIITPQFRSKFFNQLTNQECQSMLLLSLSDFLDALANQQDNSISLYLDIKGHPNSNDLQNLITQLEQHPAWKAENLYLASFNYHTVQSLIDLHNHNRFSYQIGHIGGFYPPHYPIINQIDFVSTHKDEVDQNYLDQIHSLRPDLKIFVYTVNDPLVWDYYHQLKGIYGILTDELTLIT